MLSLLRSNFSRLIKDKVFLGVAIAALVYALAVSVIGTIAEISFGYFETLEVILYFNYGLFGLVSFPGLLMAIACSYFVGRDYYDGTIRNKLIVGHSRTGIYLANFITCAAIGLFLNLMPFLIILITGLFAIGPQISIPPASFAWMIANGIFMMFSYAALFTFTATVSKNLTTALVINILAVVLVTVATAFILDKIEQSIGVPQFIEVGHIINGETVFNLERNSSWMSEGMRGFLKFLVNLFPSGQSAQLSIRNVSLDYGLNADWKMLISSLGVIAAANTGGILIFRKLNLK